MLIDNITQNLPAIFGFAIAGSWLIYTSLQVAYKIDLIKIFSEWLDKKKVILPSLLTLTLPFIFTYLSQEIPKLIDKWKLDKFVGILGAIIGAILGFLISEFRQWKAEGQQAQTVRTMLKIEINQNIEALREFWEKANLDETYYKLKYIESAKSIVSNSLPRYNQKVWNNQVSMLPIALTQEEIKDVYSLSNKIDKVEKSYSKLTELVSKLPRNQLNQYHPTINDNNEEESIRNIITSKELKPQIQKVLDEFKKLIQEVTEIKKSWWS